MIREIKMTENRNRSWLKIKLNGLSNRITLRNAYGSLKKQETLAKDLEVILKTFRENIKAQK